jgi:hypothetical protein
MCALELSIDLVSNFEIPNASYASVIRNIHARALLFRQRIDANIF